MPAPSPLWPAQLDHLRRESDAPEALVAFYRDAFGYAAREIGPGLWLLDAFNRRLLVTRGEKGGQSMAGFRLAGRAQLDALRAHARAQGLMALPNPTPLFAEGFALADPDGRVIAFGLPDPAYAGTGPTAGAGALPGRLQHVVYATADLPRLIEFYVGKLGFRTSDDVMQDNQVTATFWRSDAEHHSLAAFRAPKAGGDHHAYETTGWNDIKDWADHMAARHIKLWWGPGRHGPGNNLFFMVEDPDGYKVEISAELETMGPDFAARRWEHGERALNLWGGAWLRS
jgi:catechol 2,3-dioxygenase-like lactoylglutathione lyase family enzyme